MADRSLFARPELLRFWSLVSIYIGIAMIPSGLLAVHDRTPDVLALLATAFLAIASGALLLPQLAARGELRAQDGYVMVTIGWFLAVFWGAIPYLALGVVGSPVDAIFESTSGFTTTGSTIFADIESLPRGILLWRSTTQWLGGMGIIVLAVAILPTLGIGGIQLVAAEVPGLSVERLRPRIATTARLLWTVYALITALQILLLWRFDTGVPFFDALNLSFTTMATGGFATKNSSFIGFAGFDQWIVIAFMFVAGCNFTLHYRAITGKPLVYFRNEEFRQYLAAVIIAGLCLTVFLAGDRAPEKSVRDAFFQTISLLTTTGFVSDDYDQWPAATAIIIWILLFMGGCAGSTSGGIKQVRMLCLLKAGIREIRHLLHPRGIFLIKFGGKSLSNDIVIGVMGFFAFYIFTFIWGAIALSFTGLDFVTAVGSAASSLGNIGPGLAALGATENYAGVSDAAKLISAALMLIGRLELMTIFVAIALVGARLKR